MTFSEKLNEYISQIGCTAKEISIATGISASTLSYFQCSYYCIRHKFNRSCKKSEKFNHSHAFRNIQVLIHKGKWVIVSKNKTPVIHFVICHPKIINALENFIVPVTE